MALEDAFSRRRKTNPTETRDFALLALGDQGRVVGRLAVWDLPQRLEPQAGKRVDALAMVDGYDAWDRPLARLASDATNRLAIDLVNALDKGEYIDYQTDPNEALRRLDANRFLSLIATKGRETVGILRIVDVFHQVCKPLRSEPRRGARLYNALEDKLNKGKPLKGRPVIIGEVLFDCFPDGEVLGGAPFNIAWHLQGYGRAPLVISRIGEDARGRQVQEAMQSWGMDTTGVQLDPRKPTGVVDIRFEDKHHSFDILADQAYDHLVAGQGREALNGVEPALAYHGTLIVRTPDAKRAVDELLSTADIRTFVDVNLRDPWWRKEDLPPMLERASWVKVNDEELTIVSEIAQLGTQGTEATARALRARFDLDLLIVTLGAKGAVAFDSSGEVVHVEPDGETEVVDTVGAGDAFSSVVLLGLLEGWPVRRMMRRAQDFAGRICAQRGATSRNPELYETVRA